MERKRRGRFGRGSGPRIGAWVFVGACGEFGLNVVTLKSAFVETILPSFKPMRWSFLEMIYYFLCQVGIMGTDYHSGSD